MAAEARRDEDRQLVEEVVRLAEAQSLERDLSLLEQRGMEAALGLFAVLDERDKLVSAVQARDEENERLRQVAEAAPALMDACVDLARHLPMKHRNHGDAWLAMHHALAALSAARPGSAEGRQAPE